MLSDSFSYRWAFIASLNLMFIDSSEVKRISAPWVSKRKIFMQIKPRNHK